MLTVLLGVKVSSPVRLESPLLTGQYILKLQKYLSVQSFKFYDLDFKTDFRSPHLYPEKANHCNLVKL